MNICTRLFFLIFLGLQPLMVLAENEAGKFLFVFGNVNLELADGSMLKAARGVPLHEGTTIRSDKTGKAQVKLIDGGFLSIRPNTQLKIDEYSFNQKGRDNKGVVSLLKGTFRTISGAMARENPDKVVVKTAIGTIGIRGTDHEPALIPVNDPAFPADMQPGLYDRVNSGATYIENDAGRLNLGQEGVGFVAQPDQLPVVLDYVPAFFHNPDIAAKATDDSGQRDNTGDAVKDEKSAAAALSVDNAEGVEPGPAGVVNIEQTVEATDASGNRVNMDSLSVISTDGTVGDIQAVIPVDTNVNDVQPDVSTETTVSDIQPAGIVKSAHVAMLRYDTSAPAFKIIEISEFIDGIRRTILTDLSGHVYGGRDELGDHAVTGINETSKIKRQSDHYANNGIEFGMFTADSGTGHDGTYDLGNRYFGWITGPQYQSSGLTGSTTFTFDGGLAFAGDLNGTWSQLNYNGTTQLMVDFGTNMSNLVIDVGPGGNRWVFSAAGLPLKLNGSGEFNFDHPGATLDMTHNGSNANVFYDVSGSLTGRDDGAMFSFAAKRIISEPDNGVGISGVVSFDR